MNEVRFTLRQLEYFVAAAEVGSVTAAAELCQVSQPAVSQALDKLERALGAQLVLRQRARGLLVTPAGRRFLPQARALLAQAEQVGAAVAADHDAVAGVLRVGCYLTLAPTLVPQLLAAMRRAHPDLTLQVEEGSGPQLREWLLAGRVELAVAYDFDLAPDLRPATLASVRHHVLLPQAHPLAEQDGVSLRQLADEPLVLFDVSPSAEHLWDVADRVGVRLRVAHRARSFELVRCLVGQGLGYSVLLQQVVSDHTYAGDRVVRQEIHEPVPPTRLVAVRLEGAALSARARAFTAVAQTLCRHHFSFAPATAFRG